MSYSNKVVEFGGTDEYVTMNDILAFERTQAFSISFWFKTIANDQYIISKTEGGPNYKGYSISLDTSGRIHLCLSNIYGFNGIDLHSNSSFNDGYWHHCVWTYDGLSTASGCVCYVDDVVRATTIVGLLVTDTIVNSASFNISGRTDGAVVFTGRIDEVSIYDKALSAGEVDWIYNSGTPCDLAGIGCPSNLVAWWRMGEGDTFPTLGSFAGGWINPYPTLIDKSGNNYTGTMTNMVAEDIVAYGTVPYSSACTYFRGVGVYQNLNVGTPAGLDFERTHAFSLSAWVKITSAGVLIQKQSDWPNYGGYFWDLALDGRMTFRLCYSVYYADYLQVTSVASVAGDGNWHHVAVTYKGDSNANNVQFYVDGSPIGKTVDLNQLASTTLWGSSLRIGGSQAYLIGYLDEVAIYDDELLSADVTWIYNSGVPRALTDSGCPSNLKAWWRMGEGDTFPTFLDSSGNGYSGTMEGADGTCIRRVQPDGSYSTRYVTFAGAPERVVVGNVLQVEYNSSVSFSFWFRTTSTTRGEVLAKCLVQPPYPANPEVGYGIDLRADGKIDWYWVNGYGVSNITTQQSYNDGYWHHVVVAWRDARIYVDGVIAGVTSGSQQQGGSILNDKPFTIGALSDGYSPFVGDLDEIAVYWKTLLQAEVQWIYNSNSPRSLLDAGAPSNLVAWWRMGDDSGTYDGTMVFMEAGDIITDTPLASSFDLLSAIAIDFENVDLIFNHDLDLGVPDLTDPLSYTISLGVSVISVSVIDSKTVRLYTTPQNTGLAGLKTFLVTVIGPIKDIGGKPLTDNNAQFINGAPIYPISFGIQLGKTSVSRFSGEPTQGILSRTAGAIFFSPSLFNYTPNNEIDLDEIQITANSLDAYKIPVQANNRAFTWGPNSISRTNMSKFVTTPKAYTVIGTMIQTIPPGPTTIFKIL